MKKTEFVSGRPAPGEFAAYAQADLDLVEGDDAVTALLRQRHQTVALFHQFGEVGGGVSYAPGKWTVKQVLGHLADYDVVRSASISLFRGLDETAWVRQGIVNGYVASPRGLAFHIAGHELHHHRVLHERYLPALGT